jgi:hypothetical protein
VIPAKPQIQERFRIRNKYQGDFYLFSVTIEPRNRFHRKTALVRAEKHGREADRSWGIVTQVRQIRSGITKGRES